VSSALETFNHYYDPVRQHIESLASKWDSFENAYNGVSEQLKKPTGDESWKSYNLHKYALQQTHTAVAEIVPEDDPGFDWDTRNPEQSEYADIVEALVNDQLCKDDYASKKYLSVLLASVYGGCPVKTSWNSKRERTVRLTPSGPKVEYRIVTDQPTATLIDPRDFGYDLRARSLSEARFAYHRMRLTIEEIETRKKADGTPLYDSEMVAKLRAWFDSDDSSSNRPTQTYDNDAAGELERARRKGIEVIEMWTHNRVIVRAGGSFIIRNDERVDPIPGLPFDVVTILPALNDVWGMSLMQLLRDPQEHTWTLENGSLNLLKLALDPPRSVDVISDPDNADRAWRPGQTFPTSMTAKDAVQTLNVQGIDPLGSLSAVAQQREVMEYITGITSEVAGQSNADTATQAALNQRQAKGRIGKMIASVNRAWGGVAKKFLLLDQAFMDYTKPVKLLGQRGDEFVHVSPQMIGGEWNPKPKASTQDAIKELTKQNLSEFLSVALPVNGMVSASGKAIDWAPIVEQLAELNGIPSQKVVVDAQQLFEAQQEQTVAEAEAQAAAAQAMPQDDSPPDPQVKIFESMSYKDLPDGAQAAMLESIGLPSDGVTEDNENPVVGYSEGQNARSASAGQ
jgi:hypothetical protein